ncbi:MAG: hypothetical protein H7210_13850 [Pyrinomonadaceae bacterium]|nr:hypothetical protein [Phycisphaerales bacterium]
MDDFVLQRRVVRRILKEKPAMQRGMKMVVDEVLAAPKGDAWKPIKKMDWASGEADFVKWFDGLLKKHPIPRGTQLLWFEVPDELNPAFTSASAYQNIGSPDESYGLDADRWWPIKRDGYTLPAGLTHLLELEQGFRSVNIARGERSPLQDRLMPGVLAMSYAYVTLLVINGLPKTSLLNRCETECGIGVLVGWAEGDFDRVGLLSKSGWSPLKPRASTRLPTPEELDPDSFGFNLEKYLKAGGDLEHRDKKTGDTILMRSYYDDAARVRKLLDAGADAAATSHDGSNVLHRFGACEKLLLKLLLDAGAKANHRNSNGETVLDRVIDDGRCTVEHIKLLQDAGARLRQGMDPIQRLATDGVFEPGRLQKIRKILEHWLAQGHRINSRDREGRTPLWIALEAHAQELADQLKRSKRGRSFDTDGSYKHDQIALLLLEHGADPNVRLKSSGQPLIPKGATPLMVRRYDDVRLVKELLARGANPSAMCDRGRTALQYAQAAASDTRRPDCAGAVRVVKVLERALRTTSL